MAVLGSAFSVGISPPRLENPTLAEMSHRSNEFATILRDAGRLLRDEMSPPLVDHSLTRFQGDSLGL